MAHRMIQYMRRGYLSAVFCSPPSTSSCERASRNRVAQLITAKSNKLNVGAQIRLKVTAQK